MRAETGTGKTLAYLLPLFSRIDLAQAAIQVVIVAPTHELAILRRYRGILGLARLDANVFFSPRMRDLVMQLRELEIIQIHWT